MTAQDLKNAILQLAVQGKLVPQDPNDEPASELLKRIRTEKERHNKTGKRLETFNSTVSEETAPFDIPDSWVWCYPEEICDVVVGATPSTATHSFWNGSIPWLPSGCCQNREIYSNEATLKYITQEAYDSCSTKLMPPQTITIALTGATAGKVGLLTFEACGNQSVVGITPADKSLSKFIYYQLMARRNEIIGDCIGSAQPHISKKYITKMVFPLPPLAEQQRIVAKIEELIPLAEEYGKAEERLTVLNAEFPDKLRKSILQQAIQGKLTERDPTDEPASELLKRIRTEKERLIKEGKIKKEKLLPPIAEEEIPFEIPDTWEWIRLSQVITGTDAGKSPQCEERPCKENEYGVIKTTAIQNGFFLPNENKALPQSFHIQESQFVHQDDLLITRAGPKNRTGIMCVVDSLVENLILSDKTVRIAYMRGMINPHYIMMALNSPGMFYYVTKAMTGMAESQVNISQSKMKEFILPLPPLAEQQRIVDRVNELLAVCDELK